MLVLPSYYLAPISYYAQLAQCEEYCIDTDEAYRKQTLRNRCYIASPNGPLALTIPVVKFVPYHTPMRDIRISDHGNWRHLHWNALKSSYGRTPFFEFYSDEIAPFYEKKYEFLIDFNHVLQEKMCELIDITSLPAKGGRQMPYYQLFSDRHGFMADLSFVDLLFNMGPESIFYLIHNS